LLAVYFIIRLSLVLELGCVGLGESLLEQELIDPPNLFSKANQLSKGRHTMLLTIIITCEPAKVLYRN